MTETTPPGLLSDSADIDELKYSIENGAVGATCNPVIAVTILTKHIAEWRPRIEALLGEMPAATEDQVGWKLVEEVSIKAAKLLEPAFAAHGGRDGRRPDTDAGRSGWRAARRGRHERHTPA